MYQWQQQQPFYGPLSGITRVSRYQKKHSPTHHPTSDNTYVNLIYGKKSSDKYGHRTDKQLVTKHKMSLFTTFSVITEAV